MTRGTIATTPDDRPQRGQRGPPPAVYQRDDGLFEIGLGTEPPGPFESRQFAEAVAERLP